MPADVPRGLTAVGSFVVELWLSLWTLLTPFEAEGGELFVEGGAFRRRSRSEDLFSAGFSCTVKVRVGLYVVDKRRRGWLRRRRCNKQSRVDSDKDIDEDCGGGAGVHWGQQGGETLASAAAKLFSLCTQNNSRTWSDKGGSWRSVLGMSQREKGGLFAGYYVTERMASLQCFWCQWQLPLLSELHHECPWYATVTSALVQARQMARIRHKCSTEFTSTALG